jgi:hypothetical protein
MVGLKGDGTQLWQAVGISWHSHHPLWALVLPPRAKTTAHSSFPQSSWTEEGCTLGRGRKIRRTLVLTANVHVRGEEETEEQGRTSNAWLQTPPVSCIS